MKNTTNQKINKECPYCLLGDGNRFISIVVPAINSWCGNLLILDGTLYRRIIRTSVMNKSSSNSFACIQDSNANHELLGNRFWISSKVFKLYLKEQYNSNLTNENGEDCLTKI